jgi:hypothetical protein
MRIDRHPGDCSGSGQGCAARRLKLRVGLRGDQGANGLPDRVSPSETYKGIGTGLRESLRPFRGVNKAYLAQDVTMFRWAYNLKAVTSGFLRTLLGVSANTIRGP